MIGYLLAMIVGCYFDFSLLYLFCCDFRGGIVFFWLLCCLDLGVACWLTACGLL